MFIDIVLFILVGAIAGTSAGLLGIGGGMIVVPALALVFEQIGIPNAIVMHMAAATSLAAMIFTSSMSTFSHARRGAVLWPIVRSLLPGIIFGTLVGIVLASMLSTLVLKILFGLFLIFIATRMFFSYKTRVAGGLPGPVGRFSVASLVGAKSGLLGVGGGALTVPFLIYCKLPVRKAAGTSAACGLPIAITGTLGAMFTGWHAALHSSYTIGYVFLPAALWVAASSMLFVFVGARLSRVFSVKAIKRIFAVVLLLAGLNLLL